MCESKDVAPFTGAWIETSYLDRLPGFLGSPPSRGRGLKHGRGECGGRNSRVAPFTGAWIETIAVCLWPSSPQVAPFTGAWIETFERLARRRDSVVAPFTGAWIETTDVSLTSVDGKSPPSRGRGLKLISATSPTTRFGRPLHGGVD